MVIVAIICTVLGACFGFVLACIIASGRDKDD